MLVMLSPTQTTLVQVPSSPIQPPTPKVFLTLQNCELPWVFWGQRLRSSLMTSLCLTTGSFLVVSYWTPPYKAHGALCSVSEAPLLSSLHTFACTFLLLHWLACSPSDHPWALPSYSRMGLPPASSLWVCSLLQAWECLLAQALTSVHHSKLESRQGLNSVCYSSPLQLLHTTYIKFPLTWLSFCRLPSL